MNSLSVDSRFPQLEFKDSDTVDQSLKDGFNGIWDVFLDWSMVLFV